MKLYVESSGREIVIEVRNTQSVPDILKTCLALDFVPERWHVDE